MLKEKVAYVIRSQWGKDRVMMLCKQDDTYCYFIDAFGNTSRGNSSCVIREANQGDMADEYLKGCISAAIDCNFMED